MVEFFTFTEASRGPPEAPWRSGLWTAVRRLSTPDLEGCGNRKALFSYRPTRLNSTQLNWPTELSRIGRYEQSLTVYKHDDSTYFQCTVYATFAEFGFENGASNRVRGAYVTVDSGY